MTQYSSSYRTPFDAGNAPGRGSDPRDDDFRQTSPQLKVNNTPIAGFVGLESKWKKWDPFGILTFAGVDPVRQMAMLRTAAGLNSAKAWAGYVQTMPIPVLGNFGPPVSGSLPPATIEALIEYTIYQRIVLGDVAEESSFQDCAFALVLGEDLIDSPETSQLVTAGLVMTRSGSEFDYFETMSVPTMAAIAGGEGIPYLHFRAVTGLETSGYVRARIRSHVERYSMEEPAVWQTSVHCDYSSAGDGWIRMGTAELDTPIRHAGFAVHSMEGHALTSFTDLFRVVQQSADDVIKAVGGSTALGAV